MAESMGPPAVNVSETLVEQAITFAEIHVRLGGGLELAVLREPELDAM